MMTSIPSSYSSATISSINKRNPVLDNSTSVPQKETSPQTNTRTDKFISSNTQKLIVGYDLIDARRASENYIRKDFNEEEYKNAFKEDFYQTLKFNTDRGITTAQNKEDVLKILENKYYGFKTGAIDASVKKCNDEMLHLYGQDSNSRAYYNADYYYICEDMKSVLKEAYLEISEEFGLGESEVPNKTQHDNFNDLWALTNQGRASFDAKNAGPPPEGFRMYYKEQKYPLEDFQNGVTYRLLADSDATADGNSGVVYMTIPRYLSLLHPASKINELLLQPLLSRTNTQVGTISYNISSLLSRYPGNSLEDQFTAFVLENCINTEAGFIEASCGEWKMEADIPYSTWTNTYYYSGSDLLASNSAVDGSTYLSHFTFKQSYIPERFQKQ